MSSQQPDEDDDTLLERAAAFRDVAAFGKIVGRHQGLIVRYAARMLGGDADAGADIAQETFLRLFLNLRRYEPNGSLASYLLRIAHRLCLDHRRSRQREASWEECGDLPAPPAAAGDVLLASTIRDAVMRLPETQRAVFLLSEYEGWRYDEIARVLDCPPGTVASRKHQAVMALRRELSGLREEGSGK